jgi:hypothetical protein
MKIKCAVDERCYAIVRDKWTTADRRAWFEVVDQDRELRLELAARTNGKEPVEFTAASWDGQPSQPFLRAYLKERVTEIKLLDEDGNVYTDVDTILDLDFEQVNFDIGVYEGFWAALPALAIAERRRLGNQLKPA